MRDKQFISVRRGGLLAHRDHHRLMRWARECSEHILSIYPGNIDSRLIHALQIAKDWENNKLSTGEAMKASLGSHAAAREFSNPVNITIARSIGQAVATAHMADHSIGAALYALKAVKLAGNSTDEERNWQKQNLQLLFGKESQKMIELVLKTLQEKEKRLKSR
jgi:hypothetical protein